MGRIGILGGSFNPLHMGHLVLAERARQALGLRLVLFVPAWQNPLKSTAPLDPSHRCAMVSLAIEDNASFEMWDGEILRGGPSYTYDTVAELQKNYPDDELVLLMGADTVGTLSQWYRSEELFAQVSLGITARPGSEIKFEEGVNVPSYELFPSPEWGVSSQSIRALLAEKMSCRYLVPEVVREYIAQHNLYTR